MLHSQSIQLQNARVEPVHSLLKFRTTVDVLRLDLIHPVISGNKWFKLKEYLGEAKNLNKKIILTFGGAYSNHIVATAAASQETGFKSIGLIRGEKPQTLSYSLQNAISHGMDLYFLSRDHYKKKIIPTEISELYEEKDIYIINEGGYGDKGVEGAKDILRQVDSSQYDYIVAAVGTGTMLSGLIEASNSNQKVIGINVLKNNFSLQQEIEQLISKERKRSFSLIHDYHFNGYAKYSQTLIDFMNKWYLDTGIPSDFVYTGKLFFAVDDLARKNYFPFDSKILVIHSGGLQGNDSLKKGTLIF
jgi:1-aminocyclopropane-1-carboxylate deaminase